MNVRSFLQIVNRSPGANVGVGDPSVGALFQMIRIFFAQPNPRFQGTRRRIEWRPSVPLMMRTEAPTHLIETCAPRPAQRASEYFGSGCAKPNKTD